jgi:hypothetical protein
MPGFPLARGSDWAGGRDHTQSRVPSGGEPPAVERQLHLHHTPSRIPQPWGTTSCREAAPLTPHAQPDTPAVVNHQLSRGSSTYTTRPAGYPSGGEPPAVERQLHLHHTPSRIPQRWGTTSCREAAPLTPHAQPGTPAVGCHQLSRGSSTYLRTSSCGSRHSPPPPHPPAACLAWYGVRHSVVGAFLPARSLPWLWPSSGAVGACACTVATPLSLSDKRQG